MSHQKKSQNQVLKEIFNRLEQEIRLHQVLARKSQRNILRKPKNERSNFDDNVLFSDITMLQDCCFLEVKLQKLKDEFLKEGVSLPDLIDIKLNNINGDERKLVRKFRKLPNPAKERAYTFLSILDDVWNREVGDE